MDVGRQGAQWVGRDEPNHLAIGSFQPCLLARQGGKAERAASWPAREARLKGTNGQVVGLVSVDPYPGGVWVLTNIRTVPTGAFLSGIPVSRVRETWVREVHPPEDNAPPPRGTGDVKGAAAP